MKKQLVFALKLTFCLAFTLAVMVPFAQSKKVKANGIMIAYETFGRDADPKIICINGTGAQMTEWPIAFCEKLSAQGFQVIRFDNRDVGLSEKMIALGAPDWAAIAPFVKTCKPAPTPYSLMDMAKDVIGLMDGLKIEKAHIVGASMGGAIAQLVAIHYPERTLSLSSIAASSGNPNLPAADPKAMQAMATPPPASKDPDTLTTYLVNIFKALGTTDDEATLKKRALAQVSRSWDPKGSARQVAAILIADNCDRRTDLAKIKVPSLIIHGDADPLVNVQAAKEINAAIPNSALQIIKGMGHDFSSGFIETIASLVAKNAGKIQRN